MAGRSVLFFLLIVAVGLVLWVGPSAMWHAALLALCALSLSETQRLRARPAYVPIPIRRR